MLRRAEKRSAFRHLSRIFLFGEKQPRRRRNALRFSALVIALPAICTGFRKEHPALGGRPGPGGWRRIGPP